MRSSDSGSWGVEWFEVTKFEYHKNLLSSLGEGQILGRGVVIWGSQILSSTKNLSHYQNAKVGQ